MAADGGRRWLLAVAVAALPLGLWLLGGHAGVHAARSMLVPGAGVAEAAPVLAVGFGVLAVAATVAWLRWGTDWALVLVVVTAMAASAAWGSAEHGADTVQRAAHEFPLVIVVAAALGCARATLGGIPGFGWVAGRRVHEEHVTDLADLPPVDRCRAVAVAALAGGVTAEHRAALAAPDIAQRSARIGLAARARRGGDPFRVDHAPARAALALTGGLDAAATERLVADARRNPLGVPASEPTWVRTLDGTLAALALDRLGDDVGPRRWASALHGPLATRRGHRPSWWWTPLGVSAGRCLDWEHAAATALAHEQGWIDDADWTHLRRRVLGAAARGSRRRDDERLIAAGRMWLALVDDPAAERIVSRPTVRHDPLAVALDVHARHLRAARAPVPVGGTP
ncbi:MAG TPA: hypothetical protein DCS55_16545 [Acidimicrobiaceae bacterium]|nr:hypothetical protein [Acidimicrobiaceae bacterium]